MSMASGLSANKNIDLDLRKYTRFCSTRCPLPLLVAILADMGQITMGQISDSSICKSLCTMLGYVYAIFGAFNMKFKVDLNVSPKLLRISN